MLALLYIDLREKNEPSYEKEIIARMSSCYPNLISFDIDYKTDSQLINYAQQLIKDATLCILYIESDEQHAHKIIPFTEEYIQQPEKFIVFLEGENSWLKKLSKGLMTNQVHDNLSLDQMVSLASDFIKTRSEKN